MKEHLARFHMPNGVAVDMHREDNDVLISTTDQQVVIPNATGQQTVAWCALLESLGGSVEYYEGTEGEQI